MFDIMDTIFPIIFSIILCLVIAVFIVILGLIIRNTRENSKAPELTVNAKVVTKRTHTSSSGFDDMPNDTSTRYYTTFEVESGDRIELHLRGTDYGMLAEGDFGKLTFKGKRFISFERQRNI